MDALTRISPETRAALVALSQGTCYFPGCRTPVLISLGGLREINVEIAHIGGSDPERPRYIAGLSNADRDSLGNVLLLCVPHRRIVDRDEKTYPAELLQTWLPAGNGLLKDLGGLTEARLEGLLTDAFRAAKEQISDALVRFEEIDKEAAQLLRHLIDGHDRYGVDPQIVAILTRVSRALGALEEPAARRTPRPERTNIGWRRPPLAQSSSASPFQPK